MDWTDAGLILVAIAVLQALKQIPWLADRTQVFPLLALACGVLLDAARALCWENVALDWTVLQHGALIGAGAIAGYSVAAKSLASIVTKTPPAILLLCFLPLLAVAGCMAPLAVREAEAWEVTTWQGHLGNDQRIEQAWEAVFVATRTSDIDYTTQKAIDIVKTVAKTPAEIEEGIKAILVKRDKAMADTQLLVAKMRTLVAVNQNEAAKAMKVHGAVTEWMSVGMESSAIPNIVNEAFGLVQSMGLNITMPGITTPTLKPATVTPTK